MILLIINRFLAKCLAVSYTNEGQHLQAYATLKRWIAFKYPDVASSSVYNPPDSTTYPSLELHSHVSSLFLDAVRRSASSMKPHQVDPDVQVGLGLLFYAIDDYDKAVDCFTSALSVRPDDHILWNRLGATLANSGRSEEALEAYRKALEIKPSFVRALYNLGVGCINIGCYQEAVEYLLSALSLHGPRNGGNQVNISDNLWTTLRRAFSLMDRSDLVQKVDNSDEVDSFREEFKFE